MPTAARRRERIFESRATIIFVSAVLVLLLLGFARIYTVTNDLKHQQQAACRLRRQGRADTNSHDRAPLRAALAYLGTAITQAAEKQNDPKHRAATAAFGARLRAYARLVQPLPNPKC